MAHTRYRVACTVSLSLLMASGAEAQNNLFNQLLNAIARPASATAQTPAPAAMPVSMVQPSPAQLAAIHQKLLAVPAAPVVKTAVVQASPIIEKTIITLGCATSAKAFLTLNTTRVKPQNYPFPDDNLLTAMGAMNYHDRNTCVSLNRVTGVSMPALNEIVVALNFVSDSSGEAASRTISFRKLDNQWLLDKLSPSEI